MNFKSLRTLAISAVIASAVPGMSFAAQPDLTSTRIAINGNMKNWGGNLTLDAADAQEYLRGMCVFPYRLENKNIGAANAGPHQFSLKSPAINVVENQPGGLAAGTNKWNSGKVGLKSGVQTLVLTLDTGNAVPESNEANNVRKLKIKVVGKCKK